MSALRIRADWQQIEQAVPQSAEMPVHRHDLPRHYANASSLTAAQFHQASFRDPVSLAVDLQRLERHYRSEAERLQAEAADARRAARECRQWAANLQRTAAN